MNLTNAVQLFIGMSLLMASAALAIIWFYNFFKGNRHG